MRLAAVPQASLMACMETQTAADAPIEGAFRGAFTDHFCQVLQGQFEQVPQHEGRDLHAPLFGQAGEIANGSDRAPAVQGSCGDPAAELPAGAEAEAEALTAQQRVYRAQIKFLDTMDGAAGRLPAGAGPAGDRPGAGDRAWCSGRRSMLQRPPCWRNRQVLVGKRCRDTVEAAGSAASGWAAPDRAAATACGSAPAKTVNPLLGGSSSLPRTSGTVASCFRPCSWRRILAISERLLDSQGDFHQRLLLFHRVHAHQRPARIPQSLIRTDRRAPDQAGPQGHPEDAQSFLLCRRQQLR